MYSIHFYNQLMTKHGELSLLIKKTLQSQEIIRNLFIAQDVMCVYACIHAHLWIQLHITQCYTFSSYVNQQQNEEDSMENKDELENDNGDYENKMN